MRIRRKCWNCFLICLITNALIDVSCNSKAVNNESNVVKFEQLFVYSWCCDEYPYTCVGTIWRVWNFSNDTIIISTDSSLFIGNKISVDLETNWRYLKIYPGSQLIDMCYRGVEYPCDPDFLRKLFVHDLYIECKFSERIRKRWGNSIQQPLGRHVVVKHPNFTVFGEFCDSTVDEVKIIAGELLKE
jgi:hypothetical protein